MENRFTQTKFDKANSVYVGEGKLLTVRYLCTGRVWRADLQWHEGYERPTKVLTAYDEASLKSQLWTMDRTLKFLGKVSTSPVAPVETVADANSKILEAMRLDTVNVSQKAYESACRMYKQQPKSRTAPAEVRTQNAGRELSFSDAKLLEEMRVAPNVSDSAYRNASAKLGVPPRPRPTQAATPAAQALVPFHIQGAAYGAFMQAHFELFNGVFAEQNATIIARWMQDENRQCDTVSLDQCYRECLAAGYFRDARTLARGMNGDLRIVREYNHAELVAARRQQTADVANQPPAGLSAVDVDVWQAVRAKYPQLPVNSAAFKKCCSDTLQLWSRQHVADEHPEWFQNVNGKLEAIANKRAEVQAAADRVLTQWVRAGNPNLGQGNKSIRDTRIWLGTIFF